MRKFVFTLLLASFVVATCAILSAQDSDEFTVEGARDLAVVPKDGVKRALLIATGRHLNKKITPLAGVDPDVDLIRERLLDPRCGFQDENVKVLKTDDFPTLEEINEAVDAFLDSCGSNDFAFLYLGGHGVRDPKAKVDYYVPFDAKPIFEDGKIASFESSTCFSLKTLRDKIERCDAKFKWVVVDACRENLDAKGVDDPWNSIGELEAAEGSLWFQSCGKGQKSYEISFSLDGKVVKHGFFTWYFCQGMEGAAANSAGLISPIGLFKYARRKMREARNKDRNIPEQEPLTSCQDLSDGEFVFVDVSDKIGGDGSDRIGNVLSSHSFSTDYIVFNGSGYRLISAGFFMMGSPLTGLKIVKKYPGPFSSKRLNNVRQHEVMLSYDFYLAKYPVTKREFKQFVDATGYKTTAEEIGMAYIMTTEGYWEASEGKNWKNPGFEQTDDHPVVCISYGDAIAYIAWLNESFVAEGEFNGYKFHFRLPTEAEWEYACRAGMETEFFWGNEEKDGEDYLNAIGKDEGYKYSFSFVDGYERRTSPVGSFRSNRWGLYDMLGEVWEWTSDWYDDYPNGSVTDPKGATSGYARVLRGGSWNSLPAQCRCAFRGFSEPNKCAANIGFRVALSLK